MSNTPTPMTSREAFEAWYWFKFMSMHSDLKYQELFSKDDDDDYSINCVQMTFEGWQASQAQQASVIADLRKKIEEGKRLLSEEMDIKNERTELALVQRQTIAELVEALDIAKDVLEAHTLTHVYDALIAKVKGK